MACSEQHIIWLTMLVTAVWSTHRHFETCKHTKLTSRKISRIESNKIRMFMRADPITPEDADSRLSHYNVTGAQGAVTQQLTKPRYFFDSVFACANGWLDRPAARSSLVTGSLLALIQLTGHVRDIRLSPHVVAVGWQIGALSQTFHC
jgi:hypothetical protein